MTEDPHAADPVGRGLKARLADLWDRRKGILTVLMIALVSAIGILLDRKRPGEPIILSTRDVREIAASAMASATPPPAVSAQIYEAILPSLVTVRARHEGTTANDFLLGGGVVINEDALIITALHVVIDATEIRVTFADGTDTLAVIADTEPDKDLALLTTELLPELIVPIVIARSSSVSIGDEAFVIGNPLGLIGSMTSGIISGLDRTFSLRGVDQPLEGLIQFDAAVNLGNSGSPLINRKGQLIGIVTGLLSSAEQESFLGIGFAIPVDVAVTAAGGPSY